MVKSIATTLSPMHSHTLKIIHRLRETILQLLIKL